MVSDSLRNVFILSFSNLSTTFIFSYAAQTDTITGGNQGNFTSRRSINKSGSIIIYTDYAIIFYYIIEIRTAIDSHLHYCRFKVLYDYAFHFHSDIYKLTDYQNQQICLNLSSNRPTVLILRSNKEFCGCEGCIWNPDVIRTTNAKRRVTKFYVYAVKLIHKDHYRKPNVQYARTCTVHLSTKYPFCLDSYNITMCLHNA